MDTTSQPPLGLLIASALVAIILQLVVAPVITIFGVVPNFILVTVIITAMHNSPVRSTILGFILGLVFDFCSFGPIGSVTLVLTILAYAASSLNKGVFSGGMVIDVFILLAAIILGEFLISVIYAVVGANPDFLYSLVQWVLPAIAYDAVIGFILVLIYNSLAGGRSPKIGSGPGRPLNRKLNM